MTSNFSDRFDFSNCEDEPIRTPGAIQPHGFVVLLDAESLKVCGFSDNASQGLQFALGGEDVRLHQNNEIPSPLLAHLREVLEDPADLWPRNFIWAGLQFLVSQRHGRILLCAEAEEQAQSTTITELNGLIADIKSANSVGELLDTAASAVRSLTGYDRVMVYRFAEDWHGEVVAEHRRAGMTSYLGLHFPATDIPAQARALYLENEIRMIADVDATTVAVVSRSDDPRDINPDLTDCPLRAVSPIHLQYLRNMGVAASMSISLIRDGKLWGLIACHHETPRYVPVGARLATKLVGDLLSLCLRLVEDAEISEERLRRRLYQSSVLEQCLKSDELVPTIANASRDFRKLFDADGFCIVDGTRVQSAGTVPDDDQVLLLAAEVRRELKANNESVLSWDRCSTELFPGHAEMAAGLLALAPTQNYQVLCLWLRKEALQKVSWAGRDEKKPDDPLNPRASFDRWSETRRGEAAKWKAWELDSADELLSALQKLALRQMERLQKLSESLARSNRDLEDFAFIASHDLQEPLRKIEAFSNMAGDELAGRNPDSEAVIDYLGRVTQASKRLRALVSDLLTYSRVGRLDYESSQTDWREIIEKSIDLLEQQASYTEFAISLSGDFPVTFSSPVLLRMVFQNLLSNALKYGDTKRHNTIEVVGRRDREKGVWTVSVSDTGIGFDQSKAEAIFKPFMRLNSKSRYPGSGIGLAIVRIAADRIGASVDATSESGQGSRFAVHYLTDV